MKIAVIGAGAMGGAFVDGLLDSVVADNLGIAGISGAADIAVANPSTGKLERFKAKGVRTTTSNTEAACEADLVVLAVKPWLVEAVTKEILPVLKGRKVVLVSFAAGTRLVDNLQSAMNKESLTSGADGSLSLFTVIPNIAIAQCQSMTFISPIAASPADIETVKTLFDALGQTIVVEEKRLGGGTALASCGIAYALRYIRAAAEGGVELGFRAEEAKEIVMQTLRGAVATLQATGEHPEQAIDRVTTPGGLTIRGLNAMEQAGFTRAVIEGLKGSLRPQQNPQTFPPQPPPNLPPKGEAFEVSSPKRTPLPQASPFGGRLEGALPSGGGWRGPGALRLVVKVGSNVLTRPDGRLDVTRMSAIVDQIAWLRQQGHEVILVTSGAVACGRSELHVDHSLDSVEQRQLFSALGQVKLIGLYYDLFREHHIRVGQVLTMKENFQPGEQYDNQQACMRVMLENGVVPIVNENDTVCVTELMFTDNDELSGLIARMMQADALILLTNVDGIYTDNPDLPEARLIRTVRPADDLSAHISAHHSSNGRGGMASKYQTARSVAAAGIRVVIANGTRPDILPALLHSPADTPHTEFAAE